MSQALVVENTFEQDTFKEFDPKQLTPKPSEDDSAWIKEDFPWLDQIFIETCLRKHFNDTTLKVKSVNFKPVTAKGDNYGGIMLRAYVSYHQSGADEVSTSYVLKTQIWNDVTTKTMKVYDIHNKEMFIYEKILPQIRKYLTKIGEKGDLFPETIYVDRHRDVIVFEDLLLKKYGVKNRLIGFDHEHILLGLEKLAKIHAASAVLYEDNNEIYKPLKSGMFTRTTNVYYTFFMTQWDACTEAVSKMKGYEKYAEKMKATRDAMIENANRVYDRDDGDFHVMTHGDFWTTNLMYNYHNDGNLKDCVILDYQYAYYASPMLDFILFIYTSTGTNVRLNHEEYLQHYHKHLVTTLRQLNYPKKIPTLFEMRQQYVKKSFLKLTSSFLMLPSMINTCSEDADFESLMSDDTKAMRFKNKMMSNPALQEILKQILPAFDREGLLDPLI